MFTIAGTAANATDSTSAAAKSEAEGEKSTEDDDKGEQFIVYMLQSIHTVTVRHS